MLEQTIREAWLFLRDVPRFEYHPSAWPILLAVPAIVFIWWRFLRGRASPAIVFPSVVRLKGLRPTLRQRMRWLVPALESAAVLLLLVAVARPRKGDARTVIQSEGIAIQMVLDRSSSMEEEMVYRGKKRTRIDIVKDVFVRFIGGEGDLAGRKTDLVGLTTFARYPEESCPLVGNHGPLLATVRDLTTVAPALDRYDQPVRDLPKDPATLQAEAQRRGLKQNPLNATAIGDALQYATASLVTAEQNLARGVEEGGYRLTGKVIVLLTDGENNAGMDPVEAGRYAAENQIRLYYVVFKEPYEEDQTFFGRRIVREIPRDQILEAPRKVVETSGGKAYLASDGDELLRIYEDIDRLERSRVPDIEYKSYHERYRPFLIAGALLVVLAIILKETAFRGIP